MCKHLLGFRTDISSLFTIRNTCNVCAWNVISWVLSHNQYVCHKIETGHVNKHWQRWMFAGFYVRLGESFMALFLGNCLSKYPLTGWMSSIHDVTFVSVTCYVWQVPYNCHFSSYLIDIHEIFVEIFAEFYFNCVELRISLNVFILRSDRLVYGDGLQNCSETVFSFLDCCSVVGYCVNLSVCLF